MGSRGFALIRAVLLLRLSKKMTEHLCSGDFYARHLTEILNDILRKHSKGTAALSSNFERQVTYDHIL